MIDYSSACQQNLEALADHDAPNQRRNQHNCRKPAARNVISLDLPMVIWTGQAANSRLGQPSYWDRSVLNEYEVEDSSISWTSG